MLPLNDVGLWHMPPHGTRDTVVSRTGRDERGRVLVTALVAIGRDLSLRFTVTTDTDAQILPAS